MSKLRLAVAIGIFGAMVLGAGVASGQDYPNRPIRILTSAPGGGNDFVSRIIASEISGPLGTPVIVENRVQVVTKDMAAQALPDGYTLFVIGDALWSLPIVQRETYDPLKEFSPITMVATHPWILVAHPSIQVNSVKEMIALAKTKPGVLNFGRDSQLLAVELLKYMTGINVVVIPYDGSAKALTSLVSGETVLYFSSSGLGTAQPFSKTGKLKILATTGLQRSPLNPDIPTMAETIPGFESGGVTGVYVPIKTPTAISNRLNLEIVRYQKCPVKRVLILLKANGGAA